MNLKELNSWWIDGKLKNGFAPDTRRELFAKIKEDFKRRQIQILIGLRRTGKSTIMFQIIEEQIKEGIAPLNIVYCSFDEAEIQNQKIEEILKEYSDITGIDYRKEKFYLFIDEVQKSKNWVDNIKLIYDNFKNIKIFISGSASLDILTESKKSLAGRSIYYELKPLSFKEFLELKNIKINHAQINLHSEKLEKEFENYILRPFPEIVNETDIPFIKNYIRNSVIEPIILKDIPKEFNEVDINLLQSLVDIFLKNPGQYLEVDNLAKNLRRTKTTIYKAIFYLEFSFLIKRIFNFRPSILSASRKLSRVYAYHPCISMPFDIPKEKYAENLVFFALDTKYYWRDNSKEIDFLKDNIPVEVKYSSNIKKQDTDHIRYFLKKYSKKLNIDKAYVITKDFEGKEDKISFIPLWKFCFKGLNN